MSPWVYGKVEGWKKNDNKTPLSNLSFFLYRDQIFPFAIPSRLHTRHGSIWINRGTERESPSSVCVRTMTCDCYFGTAGMMPSAVYAVIGLDETFDLSVHLTLELPTLCMHAGLRQVQL